VLKINNFCATASWAHINKTFENSQMNFQDRGASKLVSYEFTSLFYLPIGQPPP
jgi:hypothetical protein